MNQLTNNYNLEERTAVFAEKNSVIAPARLWREHTFRHCEHFLCHCEPGEAISMKQSFIYIMTNKLNTVFYIGVTENLIKRVYQHKNKLVSGFTEKYNINKLVYYEIYEDITEAIKREKQLKGGSRQKKIDLIKNHNPKFTDLYEEIASG